MVLLKGEDTARKELRKNSGFSSTVTIFIVVIGISILLGSFKGEFFTWVNFTVLAGAFSITALVGLSQMIIIGSGGMNLSVGSIGGLVGVIAGSLMDRFGAPAIVSILVGLSVGAVCGIINGLLIVRSGCSGVASFLVTLATASVFKGINQGITNGTPFYNLQKNFVAIGNNNFLGIPILLWVMLVIAVGVGLGLKYTGIGRQILAVGGNIKSAELSGIRVKRVIIMANVFSGLLSAIAAILLVARLGSAQPDVGSDWMLFSFAAPLIGGTRLAGGKINTTGTILGAILLALISNGLVHLNVDVYWMTLIQGAIIFISVAVERIRALSLEKMQRKERVSL
jgi:Ribose/xylose/arabinose/galactoside ABC-type transport systems, permease components